METQSLASNATGSRPVLLTALTALSVSTAAAFGRVFEGSWPTIRLALAAGAAVVVAGLLDRRSVVVATLASAAGLALAVSLLVFPETTWYGLPTLDTYDAAVSAWAEVGEAAASEVAPAPPLDPLILAALTAVWTASFSSHVLAVRARSPFLALLPAGALLAFTSLLMEDGPRPGYVAPVLASALAVLFGDGLRRVNQWGPITSWRGPGRRRPTRALGSSTTTRAARRLALACLGVAVFTPGILPGFGSEGLLKVSGSGFPGAGISIDPIVDIRPQLLRDPAIPLFSVRSPRPAYWRFIALDVFTGDKWVPSDPDAEAGIAVGRGRLPLPSRVPGQGEGLVRITQQFLFARLSDTFLPAAYQPVELDVRGADARFDPASSTIAVSERTREGFSYEVVSELIVPAPAALDGVTIPSTGEVRRYTQLPRDLPPQIAQIARDITANATTPYQMALAIQDHLKRFLYDVNVEPGHGSNDILNFLLELKRGYCEQFAGTMAVLLRTLGIPARVAVGFTQGSLNRDTGEYEVSTKNAHAWVEVLFPEYGWLAFEPTPSRFNPVADPYLSGALRPPAPSENAQCQIRAGYGPDSYCSSVAGRGTPGRPTQEERISQPPLAEGAEGPGAPMSSRTMVLIALGGLVAAFLLLFPIAKSSRRRLALRRARTPRERILAAYSVMASVAADVGAGRLAHETLGEYRVRLRASVRFSDGHLDRLTEMATMAVYSAAVPSTEQAEDAVEAARRTAHEIRRSAEPIRRLAGMYRRERNGAGD